MNLREQLSEVNTDMILWNDMDSAIIGYNPSKLCAVYDIDKMIDCCINNYDMDYESALEWIEYNILSTYVGEYTPHHVYIYNYDK